MKPTFLTYEKPLLTAMIQCETPQECIEKIRRSLDGGADALGIQLCRLRREYRTEEDLKAIFAACEGRPIYITSYRGGHSEGMTDEQCAELLLLGLRCGATLCDVMGDLYCPDPIGLTDDPAAVEKQKALISGIHRLGGEVLISVHTKKSVSLEENRRIANAQIERGTDIVKIVDKAKDESEIPAYLQFVQEFVKSSPKKLLFLVSGAGTLIRYIGPSFGVCMYLCVTEHGPLDTKEQPLLSRVRTVRDGLFG